MAEAEEVRIGRLRWPVHIAMRHQEIEAGDPGIVERLGEMQPVRADVQGVGALTFWNGQQTDAPVTHRIFIRWFEALENPTVVVRQSLRPDQTMRTEIFRVRRWKELAGRKRFVMLEVEEETRLS